MAYRGINFTSPSILAAALSALLFGFHIYLNLGDYTAERGLAAFGQIFAVISAFGAMVYFIVEVMMHVIASLSKSHDD